MTLTVVALVLVAALVWPSRGVAAGLADTPSTSRWWRPRRDGGGRLQDLESLAGVADLLAMAMRSGATPVAALDVVAAEAPRPWRGVLEEVRDQVATGGMAGGVWRRFAAERPELGPLAGAWSLSEELGVALAPSMATSAQVLRARVQARRRLEASTAGARATMQMLTLLPLVGMLAGFAFGLTPWEVYGHSAVTMACAVLGLVLTAIGWCVCRWVLARAVVAKVHT